MLEELDADIADTETEIGCLRDARKAIENCLHKDLGDAQFKIWIYILDSKINTGETLLDKLKELQSER